MGILDNKRIVVTGVLTDDSLAFAVARLAIEEGAEVVLTGAGRAISLTRRTARRLPVEPDVFELDVTVPEQADALAAELSTRWGSLDGIVHAIGFAPESCLGGDVIRAEWPDVALALQISDVLAEVAGKGVRPLAREGP